MTAIWSWALITIVGVIGEVAGLINFLDDPKPIWRILTATFGLLAIVGVVGVGVSVVDIVRASL